MDWTTPGLGLRIGGHRGAAGEAPEDTFAGLGLAAITGVDYLESDELLGLDAGSWFGEEFRGERIPTLGGFLAWLVERPGLGATIEAKGPGSGAPIARAIAAIPDWSEAPICSFSADELRAAAAVAPAIPRMLIVDRDEPDADPVELAAAAGAGGVNVPIDWLTAESVARLHAAGLLVAGGTVDDAAGIRACLELGIDLVDTNLPSVTVAARKEFAGGEPKGR